MGDTGTGIVLIGLRRAGKTTVGRLLAARLGRPFVDTDAVVERLAGRTPGALIREAGEAAFRARERDAVAIASATPGAVIAAGGGAPLETGNAAALRSHGTLIYLAVPVPVLLARALAEGGSPDRPLLAGAADVEQETRLLEARRDPIYRQVADLVVDGSPDPEAVMHACIRQGGFAVP